VVIYGSDNGNVIYLIFCYYLCLCQHFT